MHRNDLALSAEAISFY